MEVIETPIASMNSAVVDSISVDWLRRKGRREGRILMRPLPRTNENDVRWLWAKHDGRAVAMVGFDPIYAGGRITGYYHNIVRCLDAVPHGTTDLITIRAIDMFRAEGLTKSVAWLVPLCNRDGEPFRHSVSLRTIFRFLYDRCNWAYPFEGNYFHKRKYDCRTEMVYCAGTRRPAIWEALIALESNANLASPPPDEAPHTSRRAAEGKLRSRRLTGVVSANANFLLVNAVTNGITNEDDTHRL